MHRLLALALVITGCSAKYIAPATTPAQTLPDLPVDPPPAQDGKGRIAFDVVDGPSRVEAILEQGRYDGQYVHGTWENASHVCTTPCVVNLPYGTYKMRFTTEDGSRSSEENVVVGASPTVYRYATGIQKAPTGRVAGTAALIVAAALAGGLVIGGAASENGDLATVGLFLHVGLDLAAIAVWQGARTRQKSGIRQWTPSSGDVYSRR